MSFPFVFAVLQKTKKSSTGDLNQLYAKHVIINSIKSEALKKVLSLMRQKKSPINYDQKNEETIPPVEISNDYLKRVNPYLINSVETKILDNIPLEYVNEIKGRLRNDLDAQALNENLKQILTQYDSQINIIANKVFMVRKAIEKYPFDEIVENAYCNCNCNTICCKF